MLLQLPYLETAYMGVSMNALFSCGRSKEAIFVRTINSQGI